jgi:hypothetical protein
MTPKITWIQDPIANLFKFKTEDVVKCDWHVCHGFTVTSGGNGKGTVQKSAQ